jgi:hypothetical protein
MLSQAYIDALLCLPRQRIGKAAANLIIGDDVCLQTHVVFRGRDGVQHCAMRFGTIEQKPHGIVPVQRPIRETLDQLVEHAY